MLYKNRNTTHGRGRTGLLCLLMALLLVLSACSSGDDPWDEVDTLYPGQVEAPTATPRPTPDAAPESTPSPMFTPPASTTPTPTAVPTPTPQPSADATPTPAPTQSPTAPAYDPDEPYSAPAGFAQGSEVFAFFRNLPEDYKALQVQLQIGNTVQKGAEYKTGLQSFAESGLPVHYYILLDRSTSMVWYEAAVEKFVGELLAGAPAGSRMTLASFGDAFKVELSAAVDKDAVMKELRAIAYDEQATNLYKGIDDALQDIAGMKRTRGELVQLVLVTDGLPVDVSDTPTPEEVTTRLEQSPEVVFHTYMLGGSDDSPLKSMGRGLHLSGSGEGSEQLHAYTDSLFVAAYKLSKAPAEIRHDMQFLFTVGNTLQTIVPMDSVPVLP